MTLAEVAPEESNERDDRDEGDDVSASDDALADEPSFSEDAFEEEEEEAPVPVSYEGIPSWEEAISYLQRRPRDSRPRGEGAPRGRGPHRR